MIAGVLGDINGHLPALETALAWLDEQGVHTLLQTGNIAAGHAHGREVIALLDSRGLRPVQGERDRLLVRFARKPQQWMARLDPETIAAFEAALASLTSLQLEFLRALPRQQALEIDGVSFLVCHGSPSSQSELLQPDTSLRRLERLREMAPVDFLVCGGAPQPFDLRIGATTMVCPGPLLSGGDCSFILLSSEEAEPRVEQIRLPL